jgi:hypothetical protein
MCARIGKSSRRSRASQWWLEALEGTASYELNGQKFFKYNVQDQFKAAENIMNYGYGRPVQPIAGVMQETQKRILEVRWMPARADDHSKAVDLAPGE